jgi:hypothetical protein
MAFQYACFVSYRHHEQSQRAERFIYDLCVALRNELAVRVEEDLFIDRERVRGGAFFLIRRWRVRCAEACAWWSSTPRPISARSTCTVPESTGRCRRSKRFDWPPSPSPKGGNKG